MSYQAIADLLRVPYRRVYKALNRQRVREWDAKSPRRQTPAATHRRLAERRRAAPLCEVCGARMNGKRVLGRVCRRCQLRRAEERRGRIAELWRDGMSGRAIAERLGCRPTLVYNEISRLRKRGADLPRVRP
jgi:transposase